MEHVPHPGYDAWKITHDDCTATVVAYGPPDADGWCDRAVARLRPGAAEECYQMCARPNLSDVDRTVVVLGVEAMANLFPGGRVPRP